MIRKCRVFLLASILAVALIRCTGETKKPNMAECVPANKPPAIEPDYSNVTIPPNIGPMNFIIHEKGRAFYVQIKSGQGEEIQIFSKSSSITIPPKAWKNLLAQNREQTLLITVFAETKPGQWSSFTPITNHIACDNIDSHLVYRVIPTIYQSYDKMGLYQRDLSTFQERTLAYNKSMGNNCVNCHSFHNYNPARMIFHSRGGKVGTSMIMLYDGDIKKIDTSTPFNKATSYRSWHPNGDLIAFAFNDVRQLFHAVGENRDVFDTASDLLLYNVKTNTISASAKISSPERMETYPEWSPDGRYLYFGSAPGFEFYENSLQPYKDMRYDLMRISYDVATGEWGEIEPVLLVSQIGKSVAHAKPSPDGKYILLCLSDYSYFPLYRPESDLFLLDTETYEYHKAENINSDFAESYHGWSSNGRWVVFSSKRRDGLCTDLYFAYFDKTGHFAKPFLLPQKDPQLHNELFRVYNVPEFVNGPVKVRPQAIIKAAWRKDMIKAKLDPDIAVKKKPEQTEDKMYRPFQ